MIQRWRNTSFDRHNAYCLERGYTYAILPNPPFNKRVRMLLFTAQLDLRIWLAKKIAPDWAFSEDA